MSTANFGTDFGQKVDLTASIRNILRNYPEGTAVLKELVQNADDAGASHISFCLDCRQHPCTTLAGPALGGFQGPSLTVYNNAVFTEEDFKSIQRIGDSLKKTTENKGKIGRFGIGFNAVYHWTDLPSFVSAKYLVLLDPQAEFLPNVNPTNPGKIVDFISNPRVLNEFQDQFAPYSGHMGLDFSRGPFNGTLFRLPLRTAEQAGKSRLSRRALSPPEALDILKSLRAEASSMLLFLKNIESIDIKIWHPQNAEPTLLFACKIDNMTKELKLKRAFVTGIQAAQSGLSFSANRIQTADYAIFVRCQIHGSLINSSAASDTSSNASNAVVPDYSPTGMNAYVETWEVANQLGGRSANAIADDPANDLLKLIPWGGVAAFIHSTATWNQKEEAHTSQRGQAYCFLPLPVSTGLPVMVNGFFELSSNRRDVWQSGADMTGDGKTRAEWNLSLMSDVVAPCYVRLLLKLKDTLGFTERFQELWPQISISTPWNIVSRATLQDCADKKLLCVATLPESVTAAVAGSINQENALDSIVEDELVVSSKAKTKSSSIWGFSWFASEDIPQAVSSSSSSSNSRPNAKHIWIECRQAVLLTSTELSEVHENILAHCLLATKQPYVSCIPSLHKSLVESRTCTILATPAFVRRSLRLGPEQNPPFVPPPIYCSLLLQYCLSDLKPANPSNDLNGLQLVPMLADKTSILRIYTDQQAQSLSQLTSMGFSLSKSLSALAKANYDVMQATDILQSQDQGVFTSASSILIICEAAERHVFEGARTVIVDRDNIRPNEIQFLSHQAMQRRSNIRLFQPELINDMLVHILPSKCLEGKNVSRNDLPTETHYSVTVFINKLWEYLPLHPEALAAIAQGSSIVPCNQGEAFLSLSSMSHLLSTRRGEVQLPPNITEILRMMGANVVDDIISEQQNLPKVFWDFVQSPTRSGIITLIDSMCRSQSLIKTATYNSPFDSLDIERRHMLWYYLCSCESISSLTSNELTLLRRFPVILTQENRFTSLESWNKQFSSRKLTLLKDPKRIPEVLFPACFVKFGSPQEAAVLEVMGVKSIKRVDFYSDYLINDPVKFTESPKLQNSYIVAISEMLYEINSLVKDDSSFVSKLRNAPFLPSAATTVPTSSIEPLESEIAPDDQTRAILYRASDLFDPQVAELISLLDQSFFPILSLQREDILVFLRTLGLQSSLDYKGILSCARFIANMEEIKDPSLQQMKRLRAKDLLVFLDKNFDRLTNDTKPAVAAQPSGGFGFFRSLFGEKPTSESSQSASLSTEDFLQELVVIPWIPVEMAPIQPSMPWLANQLSCTASANTTRLAIDAWYCSFSKRICTDSLQSFGLKKALGFLDPLDCSSLTKQLKEISKVFLGQSELLVEERDPNLVQIVAELIPALYHRLDSLARNFREDIVFELEFQPWIWVGDTFVTTEMVARHCTVNAMPYLFQLPQEFHVYGNLMRLFNIKEEFSARDYIQVLRMMAESTNAVKTVPLSGNNSKATDKAHVGGAAPVNDIIPLSDSNIDLAVSIITILGSEGSINPAVHTIYCPDSQGKLAVSTDLVNDDIPWLSGPEHASIRSSCRLSHKSISSAIAEKLGVKSLRLFLVNSSLNQSLFNNIPGTAVEAFGQSESITNRLKTILDMYPDGNPIFSELIQNADDAGAQEVCIMLDENTYGTQSLMDSKMAALQGPSLVVANDAVFTEADFRSLARIGQGSKLEKLATTGRFGLGFSSTYHLTDTPTFVSGDHLVVFDPHCAYAPGANVSQPGMRIMFNGSRMRSMFPDQFDPYCYFGCDFTSSYSGTLFRFPLRSTTLARRSEISKRVYTTADVKANIDQLVGQLSNHLIFLRSVRRIKIYSLADGDRVPVLLHEASADISDVEKVNDQSLMDYFKKDPSTATQATNRDAFYGRLVKTPDDKLPLLSYKIKVTTFSYDTGIQPPAPPSAALAVKSSPNSSSCSNSSSSSTSSPLVKPTSDSRTYSQSIVEYLIMSGLRGGQAKRLACDPNNVHLKLVPLGAVAAMVSKVSGHSTSTVVDSQLFPPLQGQTFCFLPLPVTTQLPVHVNAYWELSSNRRDIWKGEDTKGDAKLRSDWNHLVMSDVLAPLYAKLIVKIASMLSNSAANSSADNKASRFKIDLLNLLPCPLPNDNWKTVALSLFPLLSSEAILFSNLRNGMLVKMQDAYLLEGHGISDMAFGLEELFEKMSALKGKSEDDSIRLILERILLQENIPIVTVNEVILKTLTSVGCVGGEINPQFIRRYFSKKQKFADIKIIPPNSSTFQPRAAIDNFFGEVDKWNENKLQSVVFLLRYCLRDLAKESFGELIGLPFVPLINGCLGCIGDDTDAPLFIASEVERKLLAQGRCNIIVGEEILGPLITSCFRDEHFISISNVRLLTPIDLLKLFRTFIPESWFAVDSFVFNRQDVLPDEWITSIFTYLQTNTTESNLSMFMEVLPLIPIKRPSGSLSGEFVAKVSPKIPIISSALTGAAKTGLITIPDAIGELLSELGVCSLDATILSDSTLSSISKYMYPCTPIGILSALVCLHVTDITAVCDGWPSRVRNLFKEFILDSILAKVDDIGDREREVLRSLPIWLIRCSSGADLENKKHSAIDSNTSLPPKDINLKLIVDGSFIHLRSDRDRLYYRHLGLDAEPSKGKFLAEYAIPKAIKRSYDDNEIDLLSQDILRNFSAYEIECKGFTDMLRESSIFRSSSGTLCAPNLLYDPRIESLRSLLPSSVFPSSIYDAVSLLTLNNLGMNRDINCEGILFAALTIQSDMDTAVEALASQQESSYDGLATDNTIAALLKRAKDLVNYLDVNLESLLQAADPSGLERWKAGDNGPKSVIEEGNTASDVNLGGQWGQELRSRRWIPCFFQPPVRGPEATVLPWPTNVHRMPIATPSQCCLMEDMWLCSHSLRIASVDVKSKLLLALLGWNKQISGRNIALQLLEMSKIYDECTLSTDQNAIVSSQYYQVIPRIMNKINFAFETEPESQSSAWLEMLQSRPFLWIAGKFVSSDKVAFSYPVANINLEPYLFVVPSEYQTYSRFMKATGIKETFTAADLAAVTRRIHKLQKTVALRENKLETCISIVQLIVKLLARESEEGEDDSSIADNNSVQSKQQSRKSIQFLSKQLGDVCLPDSDGCMQVATKLYYDDAPWISASLPAKSIKFIHPDFTIEEGKVVGANSLRAQLFSGDEIMCPEVAAISKLLGTDSVDDVFSDLLALSDYIGGKGLHLVYDSRTYRNESLMHPGLSDAQGPALVAFIEGAVLNSEQVMQYLSNPVMLPALPTDPNAPRVTDHELRIYPKCGKRLASCFAVTDCLQILSGREFFLFDPCGKYLLKMDSHSAAPATSTTSVPSAATAKSRSQSVIVTAVDKKQLEQSAAVQPARVVAAAPAAPAEAARAQKCVITTGAATRRSSITSAASSTSSSSVVEDDVLHRFPDQFAGFFQLPFGVENALLSPHGVFNGTIIRMPLRKTHSPLSNYIISIDDIRSGLREYRESLRCSLILGTSLMGGSVSHFDSETGNITTDYELKYSGNQAMRSQRWMVLNEKGWKRSGISSYFSKAFVPEDTHGRALLMFGMGPLVIPRKEFDAVCDWFSSSNGKLSSALNDARFGWLQWDKLILHSIPAGAIRATASRLNNSDTPALTKDGHVIVQPTNDSRVLMSTQEEWVTISTIGAGHCKEMAIKDPFRALKLNPFVTIFARVLSEREVNDVSSAMDIGRVCCGPASLCKSGMPFHVEAPFIQITYDRTIPFTSNFAGSNPSAQPARNIKLERKGSTCTANFIDIQNWNTSILLTIMEILLPKAMLQVRSSLSASTSAGAISASSAINSSASANTQGTAGFYKYWPFLSRMTADATIVVSQSQLYQQLSRMQLFLSGQQNMFVQLDKVILPVYQLPPAAVGFVSGSYPLALTPVHVAKDLHRAGLKPASLTPVRLRDVLKGDAAAVCKKLAQRLDIMLPLLKYALSDITSRLPESEMEKRKLFKELCGFPALLMVDGNIRPFPKSSRERCFLAPPSLQRMLRGVYNHFIHPIMRERFEVFDDPVFLDTLFIIRASVSLVEEIAPLFVPAQWKRCQAIICDWSSVAEGVNSGLCLNELVLYIMWNEILSKEPLVAFDTLQQLPIVPIVSNGERMLLSAEYLQCVFGVESTQLQDQQRSKLKNQANDYNDASLVEIVEQMKQLDVSGTSSNTGWEWVNQKTESRRTIRHVTVAQAVSSTTPNSSATTAVDANYTTVSATTDAPDPAAVAVPVDSIAVSPAPFPGPPIAPGSTAAAAAAGILCFMSPSLQSCVAKLGLPFIDQSICEDLPVSVSANMPRSSSSSSVCFGRRLLNAISILMQENVVYHRIVGDNSIAQTSSSMLNFEALAVSERQQILLEIFKDHRNQSFNENELQQFKSLKLFTEAGPGNRAVSLSECVGGAYWCTSDSALEGIPLPSSLSSLTAKPSTASSASLLPRNSFFNSLLGSSSSSSAAAAAVVATAVLDPSMGELEEVPSLASATAVEAVRATATDRPVILINDTNLRELYRLLGVVELSPSIAIKKFTIPLLNTSAPVERMNMMTSLSRKWGTYRDDKELLESLKKISFIPHWNTSLTRNASAFSGASYSSAVNNSSSSASLPRDQPNQVASSDEELDFTLPPRRANELISWTNDELVSVLAGRLQSNYLAPSYMRTGELQVMFTDLGMLSELKADSFLRLATDIEALAAADNEVSKVEASTHARKLLRYLRDESRALEILDQDLARKLRKIKFVPVQKCVRVESGCHFLFESEICSFDQVMIRSKGSLAFTQYRILDDDISPPQLFASALGITVEPKLEVVLRHLTQLLTGAGDTIDRWNHPLYDAEKAFGDIFRFLSDNWNSIPNPDKLSLRSKPLIPVGHYLIPPSRLFFRLSEDLSPFMHEVPRIYGSHEQFLKKIGVKESPTAIDYSQFLRDLAIECKLSPLNPNELRAVIAIIEIIAVALRDEVPTNESSAADAAVGLHEKASETPQIFELLHVPDENSILRRLLHCVLSDDYTLRKRSSKGVEQLGYYMLHPSIDSSLAVALRIPKLSTIVVERLRSVDAAPSSRLTPSSASPSSPSSRRTMKPVENEVELQQKYVEVFQSESFIYSLFTLIIESAVTGSKSSEDSSDSTTTLSSLLEAGAIGIGNRLRTLQLRFVDYLLTVLVLRDIKSRPPREIELTQDNSSNSNSQQEGSSSVCYLDSLNKSSQPQQVLYINNSALHGPVTIDIGIAVGLCKFLGLNVSLVSMLSTLITATAARYETGAANLMAAMGVGRDHVSLRELLRGSPGEQLSPSDLALVELKPFRIFRVGEVVAYAAPGESSVTGSTLLRYGKVLTCGECDDSGLRKLVIKTATGPTQVLSTDVYSFKSAREGASRAAASPVAAGTSTLSSAGTLLGAFQFTSSTPSAASVVGSSAETPSLAVASESAAVAPVERKELLAAVTGLMQRAGIPVGAETQDMMSRIVELSANVKRLEAELMSDRVQLKEAQKKISASSEESNCKICLTNTSDHVLSPCGHVVCGTCAAQLSKCWCRAPIKQKIKFFYS